MFRIEQAIVGFCLLAAAVLPAAAQPKANAGGKPAAANVTTFYFFRPSGLIPGFAVTIKIDDKVVATLSDGTYAVVKYPAGQRTIEVQPGGLATGYTSKMSAAPGRTYHIAVAPLAQGAPGYRLIFTAIHGHIGRLMPGRAGINTSYALFAVQPAEARAAIAKLKAAGAH